METNTTKFEGLIGKPFQYVTESGRVRFFNCIKVEKVGFSKDGEEYVVLKVKDLQDMNKVTFRTLHAKGLITNRIN